MAANYQPTAGDDTGRLDLGRDYIARNGSSVDADGVLIVTNGATGISVNNDEIIYNRDLLLNDRDDPRDADPLTISAVNGAAAGVGAAVDGSNGGTFTIAVDGSWKFNHDGDFDDLENNETRFTSVTYTVADSEGGTDTATLTMRVTGANDGPVAGDDVGLTSSGVTRIVANDATGATITLADGKGGTMSVTGNADLLLNDIDPEGDRLTITGVSGLHRCGGRQRRAYDAAERGGGGPGLMAATAACSPLRPTAPGVLTRTATLTTSPKVPPAPPGWNTPPPMAPSPIPPN